MRGSSESSLLTGVVTDSSSPGSGVPEYLVAEQRRIASLVRTMPLTDLPPLVVGVDAGYVDGPADATGQGIGVGAAVVIDSSTLEVVEQTTVSMAVSVDYVPGLLAFREAPLLLEAIDRLKHTPELVVCDGHGIAHPARSGLACQLGVELGVPTIGCAKQMFVGSHAPLGSIRASSELIIDQDDEVGAVVRTQTDVNPVYVSPGHLVDIESSVRVVLELAHAYRLPETTRAADQLARQATKAHS